MITQQQEQLKRRRRRPVVFVSIAIAATLCLRGFGTTSSSSSSIGSSSGSNSESEHPSTISLVEEMMQLEERLLMNNNNNNEEEENNNNESHLYDRRFLHSNNKIILPSNTPSVAVGGYTGERDYDAAFAAAESLPSNPRSIALQTAPSSKQLLEPYYTLGDALLESDIFEYTFALIIYDPPNDKFYGMYHQHHKWKPSNKKLWKSMKYLVYMLRTLFPARFTPQSDELVLAIGSGDYPHVRKHLIPHLDGKAPVLMFGSSFRDTEGVYSNMIPMPMPEPHHLYCLERWMSYKKICKELRPMNGEFGGENGELAFGEEFGLEWDNLIPQLVWRGTDFGYLPTLQPRPSLVKPNPAFFFPSLRGRTGNSRRNAILELNRKYNELLPRWKGVALTAQAELQSRGGKRLPWANMKFSAYLDGRKAPTVGSPKYRPWEEAGIGVSEGMDLPELARYKYHIDLGGGGGTAWTGTIEKLAMPGLLFHHVTPTKDYIHDRLVPWKHYIPVMANLRDLKKKFDWAESHPVEAKRIADAGTEFMRDLATPEGMERMFQEDFVEPLRRTIGAYRPVREVHPGMTSWKELLHSMGKDCKVMPVMECTGLSLENSCQLVGGEDTLRWQSNGWWKP
mmetsp:Transcript_41538/g.87173  ORF Transcript_41538/g.87173 Transcript_41538/m.87173 type:complete len:623 (-) Transcript_41538:20-1888(-)